MALIAVSAHAGSDLCISRFPEGACGPVTKIYCSYKSTTGSSNNITFELPTDMDFRHITGSTIDVRVNKEAQSRVFKVNTKIQGPKEITQLSYQNPFFISDIQLTFEKEAKDNTLLNLIKGALITDYPPAIEMECNFNLGNP